MRRLLLAGLVAVLLFSFVASSMAVDPKKADAMRRIQLLRVWRLTEVLDLSQEKAAKVFPIIQRFDEEFQTKAEAKEKAVARMEAELKKQQPSANKLQELTATILSLEKESMDVRETMYKELAEVLTPEELSRYLIFEIDFQNEIDSLINQIRRDRTKIKKGMKIHPTKKKSK